MEENRFKVPLGPQAPRALKARKAAPVSVALPALTVPIRFPLSLTISTFTPRGLVIGTRQISTSIWLSASEPFYHVLEPLVRSIRRAALRQTLKSG